MMWSEYLGKAVDAVAEYFRSDGGKRLVVAFATAAGLLVLLRLVRLLIAAVGRRRGTNQGTVLADKAVQYLGFTAVAFVALDIAGADVSALLGAAGIAGIALGFAAQTSVSNVISGIFLITEKAFAVGDVIRVNDVTGTVKSIDILSVKLVTFDNQLVRIPNETLVKSVIVNITKHPVRRLNMKFLVGHGTPGEEARAVLDEAARAVPLVMAAPEPFFFVDVWERDGLWILYGVWIEHSDAVAVKNQFFARVQEAFARRGIPLPRQALSLAEGSSGPEAARPLPDQSANAPRSS